MSDYVDVICIGAVNYDYMFPCKKSDFNSKNPEEGNENLDSSKENVEESITELYRTCNNYSTQIGGSSLLALKTIHAIDKSLKLSFVGVCGQTDNFDNRYGHNSNINNQFEFLNNKEWLFFTKDDTEEENRYIGKSVVTLHRNVRDNIVIYPGANNLLLKLIQEKEKNEKTSFAEFLSQVKWIHISSLSDFKQFEEIMLYIKQAKLKNKFLKVSIDPGSEYTSKYKYELQKYLKIADYVFLNESEKNSIIVNRDLPEDAKHIKLTSYFNNPENVDTKILIIKHKNCHEVIDFINGTPHVYYHKKLSWYKIMNDTGAGDCFAGGFIAGMLSDRLLALQPAPIALGALAARTRMETLPNENVFQNIETCSQKFFMQKIKDGRINRKQKFIILIKSYIQFIVGFISSLIISYICSLLTG